MAPGPPVGGERETHSRLCEGLAGIVAPDDNALFALAVRKLLLRIERLAAYAFGALATTFIVLSSQYSTRPSR